MGGRFRKERFFKWAQGCGASCVPTSGCGHIGLLSSGRPAPEGGPPLVT